MALDPNAVYNQTVADLGLQAGWEEGGFNEGLGNLKANNEYQENEITRNEPGVYRGESNAANRGGLLTSGINGRRKNDIAANFAARRTGNKLSLSEGEDRIKREREGGELKRNERLHEADTTRATENDRIAKENAAAEAERARIARENAPAPNPYVTPTTPTYGQPQPHPAPPGMEWTDSGGGGFVPVGTKVTKTYAAKRAGK